MNAGKTIRYLSVDGADTYMSLLHNKDWLLLHIEKKNQDRWMFYNPRTNASTPFKKEIHKTGKGDHNVIWPDGLAPLPPAEPLPAYTVPLSKEERIASGETVRSSKRRKMK